MHDVAHDRIGGEAHPHERRLRARGRAKRRARISQEAYEGRAHPRKCARCAGHELAERSHVSRGKSIEELTDAQMLAFAFGVIAFLFAVPRIIGALAVMFS